MDRHVAVHLLCIPARQLSDIFERAQNGTLPTPAAIADAVWQVKTEWPARGTAVLVMNENAPNGRTWLPEELVDHMPLDISGAVQPNINVLQIVQLADLSEYVFAIHVAEPSARQLRGTDMASEHVLGLSDLLENTRAQVGAFSFSA
ncbi:hypothetical protein DENSPDRAFT_573922 [Dentipellis sp. KUC8613]|nr:hypothetical protein DENSPDRAFT_573922 [Dentipellis sp. KUC8613]